MDNNEFVDNNVAYSPSVDAIQEFNVVTNNPSAEYGQFLGGVINVSLKSGTNQFHGNVFEFLRNDFFNANEWSHNFNGSCQQRAAPARGTSSAAPSAAPSRRTSCSSSPTTRVRASILPATSSPITTFTAQNVSGNLSDLGVALHYPGTTVPMPSDLTKAAICGAGQKMGSSPCITGLSPTALKIVGALPQAEPSRQLAATAPRQPEQRSRPIRTAIRATPRWIGTPTDKDHFFARYSQQHIEQSDREQRSLAVQQQRQQHLPAAERRGRLHPDHQPATGERFPRRHELLSRPKPTSRRSPPRPAPA